MYIGAYMLSRTQSLATVSQTVQTTFIITQCSLRLTVRTEWDQSDTSLPEKITKTNK